MVQGLKIFQEINGPSQGKLGTKRGNALRNMNDSMEARREILGSCWSLPSVAFFRCRLRFIHDTSLSLSLDMVVFFDRLVFAW